MNASTEDKPFLTVGNYDWPKMPTDDRARLAINRLKEEIFGSTEAEEPAISDDQLKEITADLLDNVAAPPACGKLLDEMTLSLAPWLDHEDAARRVQLVVLPPCDENNIVGTWARRHDLACLEAPSRDALLSESIAPFPNLDGEGVLVIPNLEAWFLRHRNGLRTIRTLLTSISNTERRCLIGCNSWAWAYLSSVMHAQSQLPEGLMFQSFDRMRLHDWFFDLSTSPPSGALTFRVSENGNDVFKTDDNGDPQSDFFQKLAAHSLGIPWVAWSLWRRSLRQTRDVDPGEGDSVEMPQQDEAEERTIWVAALEDFSLSTNSRKQALLVLQSLLIHGPLSVAHLSATLPFLGQTNVVEALLRAGFVRLEEGCVACVSAAYPAIRRELSNAGYTLDVL
ncbi:MAG: hypothetical protein WA782_04160 [Sulfitobacter sp.]